ncbi:cation transporter [Chamaesiphon minutus]|uniref:Co/Zn/Cd efflux system component n=1 Tax=Chamaesiphon minutus (strain ATCC 27169 / PCC 6605) TaxID=1173020 RepID=K9UCM0_CHAP6|nr:cation transporter [Chamaesiphon minutus]AFY92832.1 Co/Zn/Cd efflux system component [Chamaesiphon minutus PCC 6605]
MSKVTNDSNKDKTVDATTRRKRRVLFQVLGLNLLLSISLFITGLLGNSSGLIANALDNLSDSAVYAISLFAIGRSPKLKVFAARVSGVLLIIFAIGVLGDAIRRVMTGSEPTGIVMIGMSVISTAINLLSLKLLKPLKNADVNLRAAQTFSINDFVSNLGILVAGGLVAWIEQPWPDLVVGVAIAAIAVKGGIDILRDAARESRSGARQ